PVPRMLRIVGDVVDDARAVLVSPLDTDESFLRNAAAIADAERIDHDRAADRPPHLNDRPALLHSALGFFLADDLAQPDRCRVFGVIVMNALHRLAGTGDAL